MSRSLRFKVTLSIFTVLVLSLVFLAVGLTRVVNDRYLLLEERETRTDASRLEQVLQAEFDFPAVNVPDWGYWDDAHKYGLEPYPEYEKANFIPATLENLKIDSMRFSHLDGTPMFALDKDLSSAHIDTKHAVEEAFANYPEMLSDLIGTKPNHGLVRGGGEIWMFGTLPLRRGNGEGDPSGLITFLKRLSLENARNAGELSKFTIEYVTTPTEKITSAMQNGMQLKPSAPSIKNMFSYPVSDQFLLIVAEIQDIKGETVAYFSTEVARTLLVEAQNTLTILLLSTTAIILLTLFALIVVINHFVVDRLKSMSSEVLAIEHARTSATQIDVKGDDEIGYLSAAINKMLNTIGARNRMLREMIVNIKSGFLMVDTAGKIQPGYTEYCESLLRKKDLAGKSFARLAFLTEREIAHFNLMFEQLIEDVLTEDLLLAQLPSELEIGARWVSFQGTILRDDQNKIRALLVTLNDISELKAAEFEREQISAAIKIMRSREVFRSFVTDLPEALKKLKEVLYTPDGQSAARKTLHGIKGNFAMFGLTTLARDIHKIEDQPGINPDHINVLEAEVKKFLVSQYEILKIEWDKPSFEMRALASEELEGLLERVLNCKSLPDVRQTIQYFVTGAMCTPFSEIAQPLAEAAHSLATRLGKKIDVEVINGNVKVDHKRFAHVFDALIHVIRNSLDHGIEVPYERGNKSEYGKITIQIDEIENGINLSLSDDGRGVNFEKLKNVIVSKGIKTAEEFDALSDVGKMQFLFDAEISTSEVVSDISGRGMGLTGLRDEVEKLGGAIIMVSKPGEGTSILISLHNYVQLSENDSESESKESPAA